MRASNYVGFHWRLFNVLTRVFGVIAVLFAVGNGVAAVYYAVYPRAEYMETLGLPQGLLYFLVSVLCAAIGMGFLCVRPYRPDFGDGARVLPVKKSGETTEQGRSWWTGERRR